MFDFVHQFHSSDPSLYRQTFKDYEVNRWIQADSQKALSDKKMFKLIHLQGAHGPFLMDENCEPTAISGNKSGGKQQALGSLRMTNNLLKRMKELDVYDSSLIIVMADHGPMRMVTDYRSLLQQDASLSMRPTFLIKRKHTHQSQMEYNGNPIHLSDTSAIVLSELGILQGDDAFSPFAMPEALVNKRNKQWESIWNKAKEGK